MHPLELKKGGGSILAQENAKKQQLFTHSRIPKNWKTP